MRASIITFLLHILLHTSNLPSSSANDDDDDNNNPNLHNNKRIAIIGGGISGSFTARYLAGYDSQACHLDSIVVFDPSPISSSTEVPIGVPSTGDVGNPDWQGGRVASITLENGQVVEIGASIIHSANVLVKEVVDADPELKAVPPMKSGKRKTETTNADRNEVETTNETMRDGFGIWNGKEWALLTNTTPLLKKLKILYRYNLDLLRLNRATSKTLESFERIYGLLDGKHPDTFFRTPDDLWEAVGLLEPIKASFDAFLDDIGVSRDESSWLRRLVPGMGCLREELVTCINLCNYNQNNARLNGLVGLISFLPAQGGNLFSIHGGNHQIISSAFRQAQNTHARNCTNVPNTIRHIPKKVTTVISNSETFELWSDDDNLGEFDVVILAAPLQQCQIEFLIQSHLDPAVLQQMPLNGLIDAEQTDANEHRHSPPKLPSSATRRYTQVVTTVVSNATLQHSHFHTEEDWMPRSVYVTDTGKELEQFSSISQLTSDGVYKMFSSEPFSEDSLTKLFGPGRNVEYVKVWGGEFGGATPDFDGGGISSTSAPFVLYDGGVGTKGHTVGAGLYYVNAIEAAAAAIEISAIGAKVVSKLVARRLGLIREEVEDVVHEEL